MKKKPNNYKNHENHENQVSMIKATLPENMSRQEMQDIIVNSLLAYDQAKKELEEKALTQELQDRRDLLGYKDYSRHKPIARCLNRLSVFIKILFLPKGKITGDLATTSLMKMAVSILFAGIKWLLWGICILGVLSYPLSLVFSSFPRIELEQYPSFICIGLAALVFAQLFRVASIEIERLKDHNYVVDIFAAVAAAVAIIVALFIQ